MKQNKTKLIAAVVVLTVLVGAWFMGSSHLVGGEDALALVEEASLLQEADAPDDPFAGSELPLSFDTTGNTGNTTPDSETAPDTPAEEPQAPDENTASGNTGNNPTPPPGSGSGSGSTGPGQPPPPNPLQPPTDPDRPTPSPPPGGQTQPPPPEPSSFDVTLSVRVDTILRNMDLLDREKHELIPTNGVIFPTTRIRVEQGETVFDVLQREMRRAGIHMSSRFTPAFNSAYVEAIHNIFEFDVGPLSGWMYRVNGTFPNFGSSQYILRPDDVIEWVYTVDLGRDVGGGVAFG